MIAIIIFVVAVAVCLILAWSVATYYTNNAPIESNCNQDCNQGRNCDCEQTVTQASWPFPVDKP